LYQRLNQGDGDEPINNIGLVVATSFRWRVKIVTQIEIRAGEVRKEVVEKALK
jgi:hypothetical protein